MALWTPQYMTTALWLDAADEDTVALDGSNVSQWDDKSGNDRHATQGTSTDQPSSGSSINGVAALGFVDKHINVPALDSGIAHHFFFVSECASKVTVSLAGRSNNSYLPIAASENGSSTNIIRVGGDDDPPDSGFLLNGEETQSATTRGQVYTALVTNSPSLCCFTGIPDLSGALEIGRGGASSSWYWNGPIGEVICVRSSTITLETRQKLEGYLAWKWGLEANLPSGHPYKLSAPTAHALLLPFDGAGTIFVDHSIFNHTITAFGDVIQTTAEKKWYVRSAYFDGNGDYLTIPNSDEFDFADGDFTIEFWMRPNLSQPDANYCMLVTKWASSANSFIISLTESANSINFDYVTQTISTPAMTDWKEVWSHIAVVRNGADLYIFRNGQLLVTGNMGTDPVPTSTHALAIGAYSIDGHNFAGYLQDLRIVKGEALYTADFNPPLGFINEDPHYEQTSLLLRFNGENNTTVFADESFAPKAITQYGDAKHSTDQYKFAPASGYFDGNGGYLEVDRTIFDFENTQTLEFWFWVNDTSTSNLIIDLRNDSYSTGFFVSVGGDPAILRFYLLNTSGGGGNALFAGNGITIIDSQTWNHVAVVRNNGYYKVYLNGVLELDVGAVGYVNSNAVAARIGTSYQLTSFGLNGYLDNLRTTKGTARYTHNFQPPLHAFPVGEGIVVAYWLIPEYTHAIQSPILDFSVTSNLDYSITTKNIYYGGDRFIEGTVTLNGAPARRRVRLYALENGEIIAETWSNAVTGLYKFDYVDESLEYQVIALDHEKQSTPIAQEPKIAPKTIEPYYINNLALNPQSMNDPEYYTGLGKIWGTVNDANNDPMERRLVLVESLTYILVAQTTSDPSTGYYEFDGLNTDKTFSVVAEDSTPNPAYNDIIRARVKAVEV